MILHPDLLRACAAYLAHADVYSLDGDGQMALLREDARSSPIPSSPAISRPARPSPKTAVYHVPRSDAACDELTHAHLTAIRKHGRFARTRGGAPVGVVATARAILDATPSMLRWWCGRLVTDEGATSPRR